MNGGRYLQHTGIKKYIITDWWFGNTMKHFAFNEGKSSAGLGRLI